jgi:hypothetical protein
MKNQKLLERLYLGALGGLIMLIIFTPLFIKEGVSILDEELLEVILSVVLFSVGFLIYSLYQREIAKHQKSLEETLNYIGSINIQIDHIRSIFNGMNKFPETKNDFKKILKFLAGKALGIISADWVLLRIVETENTKTLAELFQARGKVALVKHEISNKNLVMEKSCEGCSVVESNQDNFKIQAYCVIPQEIDDEQRTLIQAIINNLAMIYLIFSSGYYKNNGNGGK